MDLLVVENGDGLMFGPDGQPAVANVDDDQDGVTDEIDENPFRAPTTTASGYGPPFRAGLDHRPGVASVDDDGNGTTDDVGETCWSGSDDGDDTRFIPVRGPAIRGNISDTDAVLGWISPTSSASLFCIYEIVNANLFRLEGNNEISPGFYSPYVHYNYVFCASGTCYGGMLWVEDDISNPAEIQGPMMNTLHSDPEDSIFGFYFSNGYEDGEDHDVFHRNEANLGNSNFSDTFWVVSGNPMVYPHFPSSSADLDGDRDVDGNDFLTFSLCFNGSLKAPQSGCATLGADMDRDGDVDGFDFTTWSLCHNGSLKRPQAACMTPNLTSCP
jgi:hypothetical protein